jgi:raffinose/stachyose/melibiose transport system substrate-binding protein
MRRWWAAVALPVAATLLVGCGGGNGDGSSSDAAGSPATLRVLSFTTSPADQKPARELYDLFEKQNPSVKVKLEFVPLENYASVLRTRLLGGNAPDLFRITLGHDSGFGVWDLAPTGRVLGVDKPGWIDQMPEVIRPLAAYKGKTYAWFNDFSAYGVFFNKKLYADAGLKPPSTFDEVLSACKTIRAKTGKVPFALGGGLPQGMFQINFALASTTVLGTEPNWNELRTEGKTTFAGTPGWADQFKKYLQMRDAKCFQPNPVGTSFPAALELITSGKAASLVGVSTVRQAVSSNKEVDLGYYVLPGSNDPEQTRLGVQANDGIAISATTKHKAAAESLINWLADPKNNAKYGELTGAITVSQVSSGDLPEWVDDAAPFFTTKGKLVELPIETWPPETAAGVLAPDTQALFLGKKSIPAALENLDKSYDRGFAAK